MLQFNQYFPLVIYTVVTILLVGGMLVAGWWFGVKTTSPAKVTAYECGIMPSGTARLRLYIPFYLIAIFFIVFDVESAFIFTWAAVWNHLGLSGLIHISFFIVALLLGLIWIWLKGGLEWGPSKMQDRADEA